MADQITDTDDTAGPQVAPGMARDLMTREQLQDYLQIGMSVFTASSGAPIRSRASRSATASASCGRRSTRGWRVSRCT
jgi:hypothetical protein